MLDLLHPPSVPNSNHTFIFKDKLTYHWILSEYRFSQSAQFLWVCSFLMAQLFGLMVFIFMCSRLMSPSSRNVIVKSARVTSISWFQNKYLHQLPINLFFNRLTVKFPYWACIIITTCRLRQLLAKNRSPHRKKQLKLLFGFVFYDLKFFYPANFR